VQVETMAPESYIIKFISMRNRNVLNQLSPTVFLFLVLSLLGNIPAKGQRQSTDPNKRGQVKMGLVIHQKGEPAELSYDFGKVRVLVDSAHTQGQWSLLEITEQPGYKTPIHRHNGWDESFYVLEGTLTAKVADSVYELPAGSYVLVPRGTAHAQGNFGMVPVKLLLSIVPSGFERHIKDRVELFSLVKPGNPQFPIKMDSLRKKNARYIEILGPWEKP
jgi:quercetin dioxygenase-like cupin family protein